ncbi:MAG: hypothetical protein ACRD20_10350 [Terriglobales bacterium]
MTGGRLLALTIVLVTAVLITVGTLWPIASARAMADSSLQSPGNSSSAQGAAQSLMQEISRRHWDTAYAALANKSEFSETQFVRDLAGGYTSLRSYASLDGFDLSPLRASNDEARFRASLKWSSVVGPFQDVRELRVIRQGDHWQVVWPIGPEPKLPPQVIPVNYLRWDVIYRGSQDDWGAQDVESPHVRIVDMHPVDRGGGTIILGELLNEDVVPALVTVKATLLAKDGSAIATEDSFEKISHVLLPKQVTPFRIDFPSVRLSQVDNVHIQPSATLVSASADPVIGIESQKLNPAPTPSLSGELVNQSGQVVNIAHVLGTFYDNRGQIIWVSDQYANRALLPQTPLAFSLPYPADLADKINNYRVVTSTFSAGQIQ